MARDRKAMKGSDCESLRMAHSTRLKRKTEEEDEKPKLKAKRERGTCAQCDWAK